MKINFRLNDSGKVHDLTLCESGLLF